MLRHHDRHANDHRFLERGGHHENSDRKYIEYYTYNVSFGNIASQAASNITVPIQADSDFEWRKITFFAELHSGTAPFLDSQIPELGLQITDGGSGRQLYSSSSPFSSVAGTGRLPFILPVTYIFEAKASILFTVTNFSIAGSGGGAVQWDNVYLTLIGNKIWKYGRT